MFFIHTYIYIYIYIYDCMCIKGKPPNPAGSQVYCQSFVLCTYVCHPPPCLHLAAVKDDRSVKVVESEEGADGNFATVAFTMVSMWE